MHGFDINRLTVIANESYEEFADRLQREMAEDLGIQFGLITVDGFADIRFKKADGELVYLGTAAAQSLYQALFYEGYIDAKGKVQDGLRQAVQRGDVKLTGIVTDSVDSEAAGPRPYSDTSSASPSHWTSRSPANASRRPWSRNA